MASRVAGPGSPALDAVLSVVARTAARLCEARDAHISLVEGNQLRLVAHHGRLDTIRPLGATYPLEPGTPLGRALAERRMVHIRDMVRAVQTQYPAMAPIQRRSGSRTVLVAPMFRAGAPIGGIVIRRARMQPFTAKQIAMLRVFADQAALAIENARLAEQLEARNRALSESLDQQTATAQILGAISGSPMALEPIFSAICRSAVQLCDALFSTVLEVAGDHLHLRASHGFAGTELERIRSVYPMPIDTQAPSADTIRQRRVLHVPDTEASPYRDFARQRGFRSVLVVPVVRDQRAIAAIAVGRAAPKPFTDRHIALLQTFADQAVIAIENVRLFNELQARNRDLTEALEQQTATAEILRVISRSPTDVQPTFEAIAASAARLCAADIASVFRFDGQLIHLAAHHGSHLADVVRRVFPIPPGRGSVTARAILTRTVIHIPDIASDPDYAQGAFAAAGFRTVLSVPMLRNREPIGAITASRQGVQPFSDAQLALLQTFADQAVIAIENVRLFTELGARNRALTEALEQQTATTEILRAISSSPTDLRPIFDVIVRNAVALCGALYGLAFRYDGGLVHLAAHHNLTSEELEELNRAFPRPLEQAELIRATASQGDVLNITDVEADGVPGPATLSHWRRRRGVRSLLTVLLKREDELVGAIGLSHREVAAFSERHVALLRTFADQAVIAIANVRLFTELGTRNSQLTEALEQQTATAEILRVISSSPIDVQPVFDSIVESATRLCKGLFGALVRFDGELVHFAAQHNFTPEALEEAQRIWPIRPSRSSGAGRAILERAVVQIPDIELDLEYGLQRLSRAVGHRSSIYVPMLRDGNPIGVIIVARVEPGRFPDNKVELLKTFADQAVIAIENVRLFTELQARNRQLSDALEQQTATSQILRVISQAHTDAQPVFDTIVQSAVRLCNAATAAVFQTDGTTLEHPANYGGSPEALAALRARYPRPLDMESAPGIAILTRSVVQVPDTEDPSAIEFARQAGRLLGFRSVVTVPMLRAGEAIGALTVTRWEAGRFSEAEVELLRTFSDQAVIAVENVRLFQALEERNRQITESLEQQTATSEILRAISSSPTSVQPVFETILANALRLCEAHNGGIFVFDGEAFRLAAATGLSDDFLAYLRDAVIPPGRETPLRRVGLDPRASHVADILGDPSFSPPDVYHREGMRTSLAVPMLKEGRLVGAFAFHRREVRPFTEKQIELLQTFADQAVIAIENVRLFRELGARNRDLTETLEQQTATAEILRVISRSPTDLQPVFDTIAASARRLCEALYSLVFRYDGEAITLAAADGASPRSLEAIRSAYPAPPGRTTMAAQAILERRIVAIADAQSASDDALRAQRAKAIGYRSAVSVPMLRGDAAIGAINVVRVEALPFTDTQIELLKTFADQAVIAIENARLLTELQGKNASLTEALEQQTATSEILRVISASPTDVQPVFTAIADSAARLCEAFDAIVLRVEGNVLRLVAHHGPMPAGDVPLHRGTLGGRTVIERRLFHILDLQAEAADFPEGSAIARERGHRTTLSVPLLREGIAIGNIQLRRNEVRPFSDQQIALLRTFADQAVIAIENVRLFTQLQTRNRELTEALDQQTATAEILRVISRTPTDVQPVFDAIVASALRLCDATYSGVFRLVGPLVHVVAHNHHTPEAVEALRRAWPMPLTSADSFIVRAIRECTVIHTDLQDDPAASAVLVARTKALGQRCVLVVPMMREGQAIGAIRVSRVETTPFTEQQIELLKTFADQAVIAVENARLLSELQDRTAQLTRSVQQLTALEEVSRALSSTLDLETVLSTIVSRANQLAGTDACSVFEYDETGQAFHFRATHNTDDEVVRVARRTPIRRGEGGLGRMAVTREAVQIPDIAEAMAYQGPLRDVLLRTGTRALLAVPLLREDHLVGGLTVSRKAPGEFPPETIDLLKTFATQSALAIQNARLFREIEDKSRQLETASKHKSQFLANMSHELRTPLNAILGYTELIADRIYGEVPDRMREVLERVDKSGRHLLGLINDILDLSKIEAGQLTLALADYSMADMVLSVAASVEALAAEKKLELAISVDPDLPLGHGDQRRLTQVLLNLVGNALKFTDAGRVAVRASQVDASFQVVVADTGPGIAESDREKIFEEFQQADSAVARTKGGTGLGLAIARRIIEMHGGRLWVDSVLGQGSTFTFTVPIRVEHPVAAPTRRATP